MLYGPAGSLFLSKQEYQKFQQLHLDGANNNSGYLTQSSFNRLQQPDVETGYAMGWFTREHEMFNDLDIPEGERILAHGGSTGSWSAFSVLLPDRNTSIFMASNSNHIDYLGVLETILKRLQAGGSDE